MAAQWWSDAVLGEIASDVKVERTGRLLLGVGTIHRLPFREQRFRLLRQAMDLGFRDFDVAPAYGNGLNEVELGRALSGVDFDCRVTTKFGIPCDLYGARHPSSFLLLRGGHRLLEKGYGGEYRRRIFNGVEMVRSLEGSLKRLRLGRIDNFLIHEPLGVLSEQQLGDIHEQAGRMKEQGKILRWGVAGPATSLVQFVGEPLIDVLQFPLDDLAKVGVSPRRRSVAYGVYRAYMDSPRRYDMTFASFVGAQLHNADMDLILASTSSRTLASFRACF